MPLETLSCGTALIALIGGRHEVYLLGSFARVSFYYRLYSSSYHSAHRRTAQFHALFYDVEARTIWLHTAFYKCRRRSCLNPAKRRNICFKVLFSLKLREQCQRLKRKMSKKIINLVITLTCCASTCLFGCS